MISNRIRITNGRITLPYGFWLINFTKRICIYYLLYMYRDCHWAYKLNVWDGVLRQPMGIQIYVFRNVFNIATGRMYSDSHWAYVLRYPLGVLLYISKNCINIATGRFLGMYFDCNCTQTATGHIGLLLMGLYRYYNWRYMYEFFSKPFWGSYWVYKLHFLILYYYCHGAFFVYISMDRQLRHWLSSFFHGFEVILVTVKQLSLGVNYRYNFIWPVWTSALWFPFV